MTDPSARSDLSAALDRAVAANVRYYRAWGELATAWIKDVAAATTAAAGAVAASAGTFAASSAVPTIRVPKLFDLTAEPARPPSPASLTPAGHGAPADSTAVPTRPAPAALVLEASPGQPAIGAFLIENSLDHPVAQAVEIGPFVTEDGAPVALDVTAMPAQIDLAANGHTVVRLSLVVPEALAGEARGTARVAQVPGAEIAIIVRRLPA
jgi:hypothetical protein